MNRIAPFLFMAGSSEVVSRRLCLAVIFVGFFFLLVASSQETAGQQLPSDEVNAREYYQKMDYSRALFFLLRMANHRETTDLIYKIADCYRNIQAYPEAELWYHKAASLPTVPSSIRFYYGEALQHNGKYIQSVKQYLLSKPISEVAKKLTEERIYSCELSDSLFHLPSRFIIKNAAELNSASSEFGVVPYGDGKLWVSDRQLDGEKPRGEEDYLHRYGWTDRGYLRLFFKKDRSDSIQKPMVFDALRENFIQLGPLVFNRRQNLVFFTVVKKVNPKTLTKNPQLLKSFINRLELYYCTKEGNQWGKAKAVPFNNGMMYSVGHPALSPDEKTLYFVSDMPGGYGGTDIYFSEISALQTVGDPVNAGPVINTVGNERFPVFQPEGALYFSSDGHVGYGGLDVFRTRGERTSWLTPDNLGFPVNSSTDDFSFLIQGNGLLGGYFASNRPNGVGGDDVYSFTQIKPLPPLHRHAGHGTLQDSMAEVAIQLTHFPQDSTDYLKQYGLPKPLTDLAANGLIKINKNRSTGKPVKHVRIRNLGNDFDRYALDEASKREVDSVAMILIQHPTLRLEIIGHTDSRGTVDYNRNLSLKRAQAVAKRLKALGIDPQRLRVFAAGSMNATHPCKISDACTDLENAEHRKTELKLVGDSSDLILDQDSDLPGTTGAAARGPIPPVEIVPSTSSSPVKSPFPLGPKSMKDTSMLRPASIPLPPAQDSVAGQSELFDAFGEMTIDSLYLTPRNLLVIREKDGTVQRIFLPAAVLKANQLIKDQVGNAWIIYSDRRIIRIKK